MVGLCMGEGGSACCTCTCIGGDVGDIDVGNQCPENVKRLS